MKRNIFDGLSAGFEKYLGGIAAIAGFFAISIRGCRHFTSVGSKSHFQVFQGMTLPKVSGFLAHASHLTNMVHHRPKAVSGLSITGPIKYRLSVILYSIFSIR
jgi:hypothetical protein